jgi:hypothetical protein
VEQGRYQGEANGASTPGSRVKRAEKWEFQMKKNGEVLFFGLLSTFWDNLSVPSLKGPFLNTDSEEPVSFLGAFAKLRKTTYFRHVC